MPGEQQQLADGPRVILEKGEWLRFQEQVRHERIVTVNQAMGLTPCLYFGTRRCTYSDVVSIVTTVKPIPRLTAQHQSSNNGSNDRNSHPSTNGQSSTSCSKPHNGPVSPAVVAWAEKALASSKDSSSHSREPERPFMYSVSEAFAYTNAPLEGDRDRKRRINDKQALALATEKAFFVSRLQDKRRERFTREQSAALVVQRIYRGYLLRKKFHEMKTKLQIRKRIRVNLVKVTKGTAIITGEKNRRARVLVAHSEAASKIQFQFRRYCARKCVAKERVICRSEQLHGHVKRIQRTWRACMAVSCTRKLRSRLIEQRQRALAVLTTRLLQGYQARQRVRRIRQHQQLLPAQRIQWAFQRAHAEKARSLQHRRRRDEQRHKAAIQIQKLARGYLYRARVTRLRIQEDLSIRIACALSIQRVVRGFLGRQYMRYQRVFHSHERAWRCAIHTTRIVRGFLARKAVQIERLVQETDLLIQTRRGNISTVIDLLDGYGAVDDQPADITTVNLTTKNNIVHLAAKHGHFEIITHVVPKILPSNTPGMLYALNSKGEFPLELAIMHRHEKIAAYLLATTSSLFEEFASTSQAHRRIHKQSGRERSLLLDAARHGMGSIIAKLLLLFPHIFTGKEVDSWTKRTVLHEALLYGQVEYENTREAINRQEQILATVTTILTKIPQVKMNEQDFVGFTALHIAAQLGNLQAVRLLLEYGADVTIADAQGRTAWRIALLQGQESCFLEIRRKWLDSVSSASSSNINSSSLITQGSPQELEDRDGSSKALVSSAMSTAKRTQQLHPQLEMELVNACKAGNIGKTRFLVEEFGVSINSTDKADDGDSLLMLACRSATVAMVKYLIHQESDGEDGEFLDVHYVNNSGKSALEYAVGNLTIFGLLLAECRAANLSHPFGAKRRSAAHEAVRRGFHIRNWLNQSAVLTPGMLVNMTDDDGRSPLHDAAVFGHVPPAKTLINIGARVHQQGEKDLRTPLHDACRAGNTIIVQRMLQQTSSSAVAVDKQDADGRTPFFDAIISGKIDCIQLLLNAKAGKRANVEDLAAVHQRILLDQVDAHGCGLLHEAVGNTNSGDQGDDEDGNAMIEFLIGKLPAESLHHQFPPKMLSPLHVASITGNVFAVEKLLQRARESGEAELESCLRGKLRDSNGELPIHLAAKYGKLSAIDKFVVFGFDVNEVDAVTGNSLLHFAVQCAVDCSSNQQLVAPTIALVETLIQRGNSVAVFNSSDFQPLHLTTAASATSGSEHATLEIVQVLVKHNAPIDALSKAKSPSTPIQLAIEHGKEI